MSFTLSHGGSLPLLDPFSPDIDVHADVRVGIVDDHLLVETRVTGDAFPNAEVIVRVGDSPGQLVHHFETKEGIYGPLYMLPGDFRRPMGYGVVDVPLTTTTPP